MKSSLKEAVSKAFHEFILNFHLELQDKSKEWEQLHLCNGQCIIKFINDHGSIQVSFVNPLEKAQKEKVKRLDGFPSGYPVYPIFSVWEFLYPNDSVNYRTNSSKLDEQLTAIKRVLEERLSEVIVGDFSWANHYKIAST